MAVTHARPILLVYPIVYTMYIAPFGDMETTCSERSVRGCVKNMSAYTCMMSVQRTRLRAGLPRLMYGSGYGITRETTTELVEKVSLFFRRLA